MQTLNTQNKKNHSAGSESSALRAEEKRKLSTLDEEAFKAAIAKALAPKSMSTTVATT